LSIAKDAIVGARLEGRAVMHETAFRRSTLHILETRAVRRMEETTLGDAMRWGKELTERCHRH
jgi:hypothetical protein